jgi:hypothetical protein
MITPGLTPSLFGPIKDPKQFPKVVVPDNLSYTFMKDMIKFDGDSRNSSASSAGK